ncbi:MAG: polysaccharide deacetylase family protein [Isosphaeraceae bacterium]
MIESIQSLVRTVDAAVASAYLACFHERDALVTLLFHSLFRDEREIKLNLVNPLERTTVEHFRQCIEYYLNAGYQFIRPDDLIAGLPSGGKYALLTFDDGYVNNRLALEVLEHYRVPAIFFVATNFVRQQKCFWWDVLYRERVAQGATPRQVYGEARKLKTLRTEQIEKVIRDRFGRDSLVPIGEIDRPFRPSELREFARHPLVHLGNHTADHAILTNYPPDQIREQVLKAQDELAAMTGIRPSMIAYPNGAHTRTILETCAELGIQVGFTVRPEKNRLPISSGPVDRLRLGRFAPLGIGHGPIDRQCRTYRSDVQLYATMRAGYLKLRRGEPAR